MGRFEDYPGLVGTGVELLENRLRAISQGFESLSLRQRSRIIPRVWLGFFIVGFEQVSHFTKYTLSSHTIRPRPLSGYGTSRQI